MSEQELGDVLQVIEDCDLVAEDLGDVLLVLQHCEAENLKDRVAFDPCEDSLIDLGRIDIEDSLDGMTKKPSEASLMMSDGTIIACPLQLLASSEYLSDMSKAFDSSEGLPIPDILKSQDLHTIIKLTGLLEGLREGDHQAVVNGHLADNPLEDILSLLRATDFLSCSLSQFVEEATVARVAIDTWPDIFSQCHAVMGLTRLQDFLLAFFLHQESQEEGEKVQLAGETPAHFIRAVLNQRTFNMREEDKLDLVLDWAAKNSTSAAEEKAECLSLIKLKCFEDIDTLEQLKLDLSEVQFLRHKDREGFVVDINEAITFKRQPWDLSFNFVRRQDKKQNMRDLIREKSLLPWPRLIGLFPEVGSCDSQKYKLLNNSNLLVQGKLGQLSSLADTANTDCMICYRTSVFFISAPQAKYPQLCQQNFDLNLAFHVLDLPTSFRSIGDEYNCRSSSFNICQVNQYLYIIAVDAFCPMTYDTPEKRGIFRINLDLAIESCNQALAVENASMLQWEHFTDIPEEYLISSPNRLFNSESIKTVGVGKDLFILNDDICVCLDIQTRSWKEIELAPPARSNPVVFGSETELFILGGSCMGKHLVSGQRYNTSTWRMELLPNIPASVMLRQDLRNYHGLHHGNRLYLGYNRVPGGDKNAIAIGATPMKPLLVLDIFLKQWSSDKMSNSRLFCLDKPIWM